MTRSTIELRKSILSCVGAFTCMKSMRRIAFRVLDRSPVVVFLSLSCASHNIIKRPYNYCRFMYVRVPALPLATNDRQRGDVMTNMAALVLCGPATWRPYLGTSTSKGKPPLIRCIITETILSETRRDRG